MFRHRLVPFLIIFLLILPVILWFFLPTKHLTIVVLDKTVPDTSYREHRGLFWVLNNSRYVKEDGSFYHYSSDYYGYHPGTKTRSYTIKDLPVVLPQTDLIYITDTYGVYEDDLHEVSMGERSNLIYGGLKRGEIDTIREALYGGATLIAEFNTFADPTNPHERELSYELLGVRWSGWIGRYFSDLDGDEIPPWVQVDYQRQYGREWTYTGGGFLFVHESSALLVLQLHKDTTSLGSKIHFTQQGIDFFHLKRGATYSYWFDIVIPDSESYVLATYAIQLTEEGERRLQERGIPLTFPAIVKNKTNHYTSYYFAGDYADNAEVSSFYQIAFWDHIRRWLSIDHLENLNAFYWRIYVPMMKRILSSIEEREEGEMALYKEPYIHGETRLISRVRGPLMELYRDGDWTPFIIKGVNLGTALPGKWFTQFPERESYYRRWLEMIGDMYANTVRVYTLLDPAFYRALYNYNLENPERPLYLLQEIWPEEHPDSDDLFGEEYLATFLQEIEYVVDAIHGQADIPKREYRAYGRYYLDLSPYLLGFLVGREFEPHEVVATDTLHEGCSFEGTYFYTTRESTPTESWLALTCDYLLSYQKDNYQWQHPVAIVSWPPLDPMDHSTETLLDGRKSFNDMVAVDIRAIKVKDTVEAGFFGAYHIYPNYPDFINLEPAYDAYHDDEGCFRYGGYLQHFMQYHEGYAALVAEFGLATGMGNAHSSPDGYHHGGIDEVMQGEGTVRMMETILEEGYMGGVIFAWMDEWAKKTWTTEPFMIPYERQVLWHNAIDPEQNYGILAIETIKPAEPSFTLYGEGVIERMDFSANEAFFYVDIFFHTPMDLQDKILLLGLDTYDGTRGEFLYHPEIPRKAPSGMEFLVELTGREGRLLVTPDYNASRYRFSSSERVSGIFEEIQPLINKEVVLQDGTHIEPIYEEGSLLSYGPFLGYHHHWHIDGSILSLRLPWGRLGVTDPSRGLVLHDERELFVTEERDMYQVVETEGFVVTALLLHEEGEVLSTLPPDLALPTPFLWDFWEIPVYRERLKESYSIIREYFKGLEP